MAARDDVPIASGMRRAVKPSRRDERLANLELADPCTARGTPGLKCL